VGVRGLSPKRGEREVQHKSGENFWVKGDSNEYVGVATIRFIFVKQCAAKKKHGGNKGGQGV